MNNTIVKFSPDSSLYGYGFDILADRVVRFNKYADGTYMTTRATYSINGKQYTHYDIRQSAITLANTAKSLNGSKVNWKLAIRVGIAAIIVLVLLSTCSIDISVDTTYFQDQSADTV